MVRPAMNLQKSAFERIAFAPALVPIAFIFTPKIRTTRDSGRGTGLWKHSRVRLRRHNRRSHLAPGQVLALAVLAPRFFSLPPVHRSVESLPCPKSLKPAPNG